MSLSSRKTVALLFSLLAAMLLLGGCATSYKSVSLDIAPTAADTNGEKFFHVLIDHLARMRGDAFARLYLRGEYDFRGMSQTSDGRQAVYLLEANLQKQRAHIPTLQYSYIYFDFRGSPRLIAQENTSLGQTSTNDGDGPFEGTFKLTILGARYCSGDTKDLPEVEGDGVHIVQYGKVYLRSIKRKQQKYFTSTYCQGVRVPPDMPGLEGVRFYFKTKADMDRFASALLATFPFIEPPKQTGKTQ